MLEVDGLEFLKKAQRVHKGGDGIPPNLDKAEIMYNEALNHNPGNPWILLFLSVLYLDRGYWGLGAQLCAQITQTNPEIGEAWSNLGIAYRYMRLYGPADEALKKAEAEMPYAAAIPAGRAALRVNQGVPEECLALAEKALKLDPECPDARWNKALALLELGRLGEAWPLWEQRRTGKLDNNIEPRNYHMPAGQTPDWDGMTRGKLVIHGEQGLGDEIMFATCIPDAIAANGNDIIFECAPRLEKMFARAFPEIRVKGTHFTDGREWIEELGRPDFLMPVGSLPGLFRKDVKAFPKMPYLVPDPEDLGHWNRERSKDKLRVGISWQGGVEKTHVYLRSMMLNLWKPILQQDCEFISLQYHPTVPQEIEAVQKEFPVEIKHYPGVVGAGEDYDKTVSLLASLDLLITVTQTCLHAAGALGIPCWVLTPSKPDWRMGIKGDHMAWYPDSLKIYRQEGDDWEPVIERVANDLAREVHENHI